MEKTKRLGVRTLDAREWPGFGLLPAGWEGDVDEKIAEAMVASGYATLSGAKKTPASEE
jgi:hypothetical protein